MYCPNCGASFGADDVFCANCGTRLRVAPSTINKPDIGANYPFKLVIVAGLILIVIVFALVANPFTQNTPEGVAESFIQKVINEDIDSSIELCTNYEDAQFIIGLVKMGLSMTSDRTFHCDVVEQSDNFTVIEVYGASGYFCTMELENINGKWLISYVE